MNDDQWQRMITGLRSGDSDACTDFWNTYGPLLESVAQRQLSGRLQRRVGSDDIVQRPVEHFFGEFPMANLNFLMPMRSGV